MYHVHTGKVLLHRVRYVYVTQRTQVDVIRYLTNAMSFNYTCITGKVQLITYHTGLHNLPMPLQQLHRVYTTLCVLYVHTCRDACTM